MSPTPCADRSAGAATQMTPAVEGTDNVDSDRSMCGSDNGRSNKSGKGKARVSKVTRRHPTEAATSDKAPGESTELAKRLKAMLGEVRDIVQRDKSNSLVNNAEEVKQPTLDRAPASLAGSLNSNQKD